MSPELCELLGRSAQSNVTVMRIEMNLREIFFADISGPSLIYQTKDKGFFKSRDTFLQALDVTVLLKQKSS